MFGLTNGEGNHGEDAKEYWFYLDSTPTHSYMKCLYKYPQRGVPVRRPGRRRTRARGKQRLRVRAARHRRLRRRPLLRRGRRVRQGRARRPADARHRAQPRARGGDAAPAADAVVPQHVVVGRRRSRGRRSTRRRRRRARVASASSASGACDADARELLFCENETNNERLFGTPNARRTRRTRSTTTSSTARPTRSTRGAPGRRCAAHHVLEIPAGGSASIRVRLTPRPRRGARPDFDARARRAPRGGGRVLRDGRSRRRSTRTAARVMRQALAGLLWGKQYYEYDVHRWLREHGVNPWDPDAPAARCATSPWFHMVAGDVISMPDKWEYPWFAAWDLAFHCAPLSLVDVDFAKEQVELLLAHALPAPQRADPGLRVELLRRQPAGDAWAALWVYEREARDPRRGRPRVPRARLPAAADELHLVGQPQGPRRAQPVPGRLPRARQHRHLRPLGAAAGRRHAASRPTARRGWPCTASGCCRSRSSSAREDPAYADIALKFVAHFAWIAIALNPPGADTPLWDEQDGFFYDVMRMPDGHDDPAARCARSSGCCRCARRPCSSPTCSTRQPGAGRARAGVRRAASRDVVPALAHLPGAERRRAGGCSRSSTRRSCGRSSTVMLDEDEFLGPHGIRAISRRHLDAPVRVRLGRPALRGPLPAGGVGHRHVRRQLELARAGLVPDEPRDPARAAPAAPLLRRRVQGRVPDRLRARAEPARGGAARSAAG